jgi:hypothetical protein
MSEIEHLNHDELLDVVRRLGQALSFVDHIITEDKSANQIWVVSGTVGGGLPNLTPCASVDELTELVRELRTRQMSHPEERLWLHIFSGQRWKIQKGKTWQLWDGNTLIPIDSKLEPVADDSGSLFDRVDLDRVLADNPTTSPAHDTSNEIRIGPQVIGQSGEDDDDSAPDGEDPEIV